jgi:ribosomal protein S25
MAVDLQRVKGNASKAVDALLKTERENSALRSELLKTLERCTTEAALAQQKLAQTYNKTKEHKKLSEKLKKCCDRAATVQANALKRATDRVKKESEQLSHQLVSRYDIWCRWYCTSQHQL